MRFRWRLSTDNSTGGPFGWVVDDVRVYTCGGVIGNTAPTEVNAGDNQTVTATLPTAINLTGYASDDGIPGAGLVPTWSNVTPSSPGLVTFGTGNSFSTTATFSVAGKYTLRLTVSDGELTSYDEVTITINPLPATAVHVHNILTGTQDASRGQKNGTATVTIFGDNGKPVGAGYVVDGNFSGSYNEPGVPAMTDASGVAVFVTTGTKKNKIVFNFCVSDVTVGGLPYDSADNESPAFDCGEPPPPLPTLTDVHVEDINTGQQGVGGGDKVGTATVKIYGNNDLPQSDYEVAGNFSGDFNEPSASQVTDADGTVTFQTVGTKNGKVSISFCVSSVSGMEPYDP